MADLNVTLSESVTLNGSVRGTTNTLTITDIEHVMERIVTIPSSIDTTVVVWEATVGTEDSAVDIEDTKYIRITNLDSTNSVNLSLQIDANEDGSSADESCTILLEAGHSFVIGTPHDSVCVKDFSATIDTDLHDLESILVDSGSNAVKLEVFVAGV